MGDARSDGLRMGSGGLRTGCGRAQRGSREIGRHAAEVFGPAGPSACNGHATDRGLRRQPGATRGRSGWVVAPDHWGSGSHTFLLRTARSLAATGRSPAHRGWRCRCDAAAMTRPCSVTRLHGPPFQTPPIIRAESPGRIPPPLPGDACDGASPPLAADGRSPLLRPFALSGTRRRPAGALLTWRRPAVSAPGVMATTGRLSTGDAAAARGSSPASGVQRGARDGTTPP